MASQSVQKPIYTLQFYVFNKLFGSEKISESIHIGHKILLDMNTSENTSGLILPDTNTLYDTSAKPSLRDHYKSITGMISILTIDLDTKQGGLECELQVNNNMKFLNFLLTFWFSSASSLAAVVKESRICRLGGSVVCQSVRST